MKITWINVSAGIDGADTGVGVATYRRRPGNAEALRIGRILFDNDLFLSHLDLVVVVKRERESGFDSTGHHRAVPWFLNGRGNLNRVAFFNWEFVKRRLTNF